MNLTYGLLKCFFFLNHFKSQAKLSTLVKTIYIYIYDLFPPLKSLGSRETICIAFGLERLFLGVAFAVTPPKFSPVFP